MRYWQRSIHRSGCERGRRRRAARGHRRSCAVVLLAFIGLPLLTRAPAAAQEDSLTVVPGPGYAASPLRRLLLGSGHRELWLTPIRVPVVRIDTFAGGLTVLQRGTSLQTISLRLRDPEGLEWVFRSVDKEQSEGLPRDLQNTLLAYVAQDLVAAKHPGGALVIAPLLDAAGVLRASPRIAVLADGHALGEHRERFAGMLGIVEERPNEVEDGETAGFWGSARVIGSERLLERLEESSEDRVDSRAYLRARLMDILVGDWDRHPDQWRWAEDERDGIRYWLPIPRDRDNAFPRVNGVVARVAELVRPTVRDFDADYSDLYQLIHNAQPLDRPILAELPAAAWDSVAADLVDRLTDGVLEEAVAALPAEWHALVGAELLARLRARRDGLPTAARRVYRMMASEVDVRATDERDRAVAERLEDGSLRLRIAAPDRSPVPYFDRTFLPGETREVRVWLLGGDDEATIAGTGRGVGVRLIGGGGRDRLEDRSARGPALNALYDESRETTFVRGPSTRIDRRPYQSEIRTFPPEGNAPPPREWGSLRSRLDLSADWVSGIGPIVGGGPSFTRYGFRRLPYSERVSANFLLAPLNGRFGVEAKGRFLRTGGGGETRFELHASQLEATNFHGFGNETSDLPSDVRRILGTELAFAGELVRGPEGRFELSFGPVVRYLDPEVPEPNPALQAPGVVGARAFGVGGVRAALDLRVTDDPLLPTRGFRVEAAATGFPLVWGDAGDRFANGSAAAYAYLPLLLDAWSLALRAGAERSWGPAPLQYAAALGGSQLRGYRSRRFTGESAIHAGAELRTKLGRANLVLLRGEVGALALVDGGRVFLDGEESDRWHVGRGAGLWFAAFDRDLVVHALWARGEKDTLKVGLGMAY